MLRTGWRWGRGRRERVEWVLVVYATSLGRAAAMGEEALFLYPRVFFARGEPDVEKDVFEAWRRGGGFYGNPNHTQACSPEIGIVDVACRWRLDYVDLRYTSSLLPHRAPNNQSTSELYSRRILCTRTSSASDRGKPPFLEMFASAAVSVVILRDHLHGAVRGRTPQ